ncbi:uncharacterized protein LOC134267868 [Saccostrea cucullata]|uniref:uncharacterized protein LOC134267868 n=1 Tax=Saccostrea cuccullata TaxID=36930 RepID=UPI002ED0FCD5
MYRIFTMATILQVMVFCFSYSIFASASHSEVAWTYGETNGPAEWRNSYPICGLNSQSPINLPDTGDMTFDPSLKPFQISGFSNPQDYKLKINNNGHTVQVSVEEGNLTVEGGGLPGRYKTAQFHFHWGRDNTQGSEHQNRGTLYPMELHVVNYNEKYGNLSNAASQEGDGLAVLGFFFVPNGNTDNSALTTLLNKFNDVKTKGAESELTGFNIDLMLPFSSGNADRFYRYSGSLTTPPCYESVVWTMFESTIPISDSQLAMFRMLQEDDTPNSGNVIVDNFRPVQALNGRQVRRSFASSASGLQIPFLALLLVLLRLLCELGATFSASADNITQYMYRIFTMATIVQVMVFCFSYSTFASASEVAWTYGETNGPAEWRNSYPICGLNSQSPINLPDTEDMTFDPSLKPFQISGFTNPQDYKLKIKNNGHTVQVSVEEGNLMVEGGGLPGRYKTAQFHFHWGRDNTQGSEHLNRNTHYPMELHVVNYNEKYGNLSNAASKEGDGLAVLGFFFVPNGNTDNSAFTTLLNKFNDVKLKDAESELTGFNIDFMLPFSSGNADRFYRYSGSLTTPPCYESVVWTIFESTIPISDSQLAMFRMLQEDNTPNSDHVIVDNFRPVQALNGRQVRRSFASSASGLQISFLALLLVLLRFL